MSSLTTRATSFFGSPVTFQADCMYFDALKRERRGELSALGVEELLEQLLLLLDPFSWALYSSTTDFGASGYSW